MPASPVVINVPPQWQLLRLDIKVRKEEHR